MLLAALTLLCFQTPTPASLAQQGLEQFHQAEADAASGKIQGLEVVDAFFAAARTLREACADGEAGEDAFEAWSEALINCSDLEGAEEAARAGLKAHPASTRMLLQLGRVLLTRAQQLKGNDEAYAAGLAQARAVLQRAYDGDSKSAAAALRLGEVEVFQGELDAAADCWRAALSRDASAVDLGSIAQWLGPERAVAILEERLAQHPKDAMLHWYLGAAEYQRLPDRWSACRKHFETAVALEPSFDACWLWLGQGADFTASKRNEAGDRKAASQLWIYAAKSWARYLSGNGGPAQIQALAAQADQGEAFVERIKWFGGRAFAAGQGKDAVSLYSWVVRARPRDTEAWNNLAFFEREIGEAKAALAAYRRALQLQPDDPQVMNDLAVILHYYLKSDDDEAKRLYQAAIDRAEELLAGDGPADPKETTRIRTALRDARNNLKKLEADDRSPG